MNQHPQEHGKQRARHLVHPRWVWTGLVFVLAGVALAGVGIALASWAWTIAGAAIALVGAGTVIAGGGMYDARASLHGEMAAVAHGDVHEGVAPGEMVHDEKAQQVAVDQDAVHRRVLAARERTSRPPLAPIGAGLLILVGVILMFAQWALFPTGVAGQDNGLRDLIFGMIGALAGMRVLVAQPGPHPIAGGVGLVCGLILLLGAFLAGHRIGGTEVVVGMCGVFAIAGALACLLSPDAPLEEHGS